MIEHEPLISEYSHEKFRPREAEALKMLQKVASMVKPIMRQRGWKVGILTEFWPPEKNLLGLNWNQGQKVCLRLRYPYDERQFLPFEDVVDTMLHELCHIIHGPHNEAFHSLWNQLRDEREVLLRKGYTGEGFLSNGHKLGGARIPMHEARQRARAAAEKRQALNAGSGQRLGGVPVRRGDDIRKIIADAAQRRQIVTKGCASDNQRTIEIIEEVSRNGFRTKADEDDANEQAIMQAYIELIQEEEREKYGESYIPPSQDNPSGRRGFSESLSRTPNLASTKGAPPAIPSHNRPINKARAPLLSSDSHALPKDVSDSMLYSWKCEVCTLHNPAEFLCCDACMTEKGSAPIWKESYENSQAKAEAASKVVKKTTIPSLKPDQQYSQEAASRLRANRSLRNLATLAESGKYKPLGWLCDRCGAFMENEWWTCSSCGTLKQNS